MSSSWFRGPWRCRRGAHLDTVPGNRRLGPARFAGYQPGQRAAAESYFSIVMPRPTKVSRRFWLTFSAAHVKRPFIWELSQKHPVVFDIRSASVTAEVAQIDAAVVWLQRHGVQVDPV
jgi:hypothetical protein